MYHCSACKKSFTSVNILQYHLRHCKQCQNNQVYRCDQNKCQRHYTNIYSLIKHIKTNHVLENQPLINTSETSLELEQTLPNRGNSPIMIDKQVAIKSISSLLARFYAEKSVPRSVVQKILNSYQSLMYDTLSAVRCSLDEFQKQFPSHSEQFIVFFNNLRDNLIDSFTPFTTEYKRLKYFSDLGSYIAPVEIIVGQQMKRKRVGLDSQYLPTKCIMHIIPLKAVFEQFFSIPEILSTVLEHIEELYSSCSYSQPLVNIIQGSVWERIISSRPHEIIVPLILFFDDLEIGNPLGSRSGTHKLGTVYLSIPVLRPEHQSLLDFIFLAALFHSKYRNKFGNNMIFHRVIEKLNILSRHGIDIETDIFKGNIKLQVAVITGDNLGLHSMLGFVESFSANYPCRICLANKEMVRTMCYEDTSLLRTNSTYMDALETGDVHTSGVKEKCCFLNLDNFQIFENVAVDFLHDMLEGVCRYTMIFIIKHFVKVDKLFTLELLNDKLLSFDWGPDEHCKPRPNIEFISNTIKMRMSASEMLIFMRYFGIIVGEYIPEDHNVWEMYIVLRNILDQLLSDYVTAETVCQLKHDIEEFTTIFQEVTREHLRPKFHFLIHYPSMLLKFGPVSKIWTMRFEGYHKVLKMAGRISQNKVNMTKTIAMRNQLYINNLFLTKQLTNHFSYGMAKTLSTKLSEKLSDQFLLRLPEKLLHSVKWVRIKGVQFQIGSIISVDMDSEGPTFGKVISIFLSSKSNVYFRCISYKTLYFDSHYFGYTVVETNDIIYSSYNALIAETVNKATVMRDLTIIITQR